MEPTEKDIVIEKVKEMPADQVEKVIIFMAGLEAGSSIGPREKQVGFERKRE